MDDYLRAARRATVGVSALGWVALLCLIASIAFWMALFIDLLAPPRIFSPQTIQAGLAVIAFSLVQPLLWSMLLPSSPAGRLLQKQTWRTPGYAATIAAAVFLSYHSFRWLSMWWAAQPQIASAGEAGMLSITSMIAAVLMPALAWCVVTPEQWIAQIEQARHVKRLEMAMKMEEAAMRASAARAIALLNAGISNLAIEQRRELGGILGGFARAQQNALIAIGGSWKQMYGVEMELGTIPDKQLVAQYSQVVNLLADSADAMDDTASYVNDAPALAAPSSGQAFTERPNDRADDRTALAERRTLTPHQDTADRVHRTTGRTTGRTTSGPLADHRTTGRTDDRTTGRPYAQPFATARQSLRGAWRRAELEQVLSVSKTQASEYIKAWVASGDIIKLDEPRDHYQFEVD